ncbi:hypothetical protein BO71DRAFT_403319 [Aspergillus ellipticus CBS 707.79]|uniref:Uncharacterized protein n=1 Tax=Aspergillus ellipticus CBS 707.79 TaxID=1448320 RepID=A0A319CWU2_9EURO|nr:hypothetical protein BO71DRAFT_403319 [Aspergillus ellipticus CBS 707.79]
MSSSDDPHTHTHQASSTTNVPTLHTLHPMKRSISYSPDSEESHSPTSSRSSEHRGGDHMVKAALTELLNDDSVRSNARGSRSVQNFLMETEHALRKQRRQSLNERVATF